MIHDLLFALLGFTGDFFILDKGHLIMVESKKKYFEKWDIAILFEILKIATSYMQIRDWVVANNQSLDVYIQASSRSIRENLLAHYEQWVGDYEKKMIQEVGMIENSFSLSSLRLELNSKWANKFESVSTVLNEFSFNLIYLSQNSDLKFLQKTICNVLVREMVSWCKYGVGTNVWPSSVVDSKMREKIDFCGKASKILEKKKLKPPPGFVDTWEFFPGYLTTQLEVVRAEQSARLDTMLRSEYLKEFARIRGFFLLGFGHLWTEFLSGDTPDWDGVSGDMFEPKIEYRPVWPINELIITSHQISKYNEIFTFLFRLKRIVTKLFSKTDKSILGYKLGHFFQSLFGFLQIDLIESEWNPFMSFVHETKDVQEIAHAHSRLVTKLYTGCLLSAPHVMESVLELERIAYSSEPQEIQFTVEMQTLFTLFEELQLTSTYSSINRLISKLDYNSFYRNKTRA